MDRPGEVTLLLRAHREGDPQAFEKLVDLVYPDLKRISSRILGGREQTLSATGVVHEAWLKLSADARAAWNDRTHFLAVAGRAMRQVIIDYARLKLAQKRGGSAVAVTLDESAVAVERDADWVLAVHEALGRMAEHHPRLARLVELRFFGGLTDREIAEALDLSLRTVERDWPRARAWLKEALRDPNEGEADGR